MMRRVSWFVVGVAALSLAGCGHFTPGKAGASAKSPEDRVSNAIASAAKDAADGGMPQESLIFQEKLYRSDPHNEAHIINYGRALRKTGNIEAAKLVVRTPAKGKRASGKLLTEASMVMIASGEYEEALNFAQQALEKDKKSPDAHHALALSLSGLDKNADAQLQYERALELWPETRDRTPIINNLAMSMAAQGKISEARSVMSQATGEALRSAVYQNNRSLLNTLKDRDIRAEKVFVEKPSPDAPAGETKSAVKMAPITDDISPVEKQDRRASATISKMKPIIE